MKIKTTHEIGLNHAQLYADGFTKKDLIKSQDEKWVSVESILSVIENSHKYPKEAGMKLKYIKDQLTKANTKGKEDEN